MDAERTADASASPEFTLTLGHVLHAAGVTDLQSVLAIRHTQSPLGIANAEDVAAEHILRYTREQDLRGKVPSTPPPLWLLFMGEGGRRSRLLWSYQNFGELVGERTAKSRFFDLRPSTFLASLNGRLVIEWSRDAVNWAKPGTTAAGFQVVEIADPAVVPFPGFDRLVIDYSTLQRVISDRRYADWRTALRSVQGIYLIADTKTGRLYVGKADGSERILGRWSTYAQDGHGGNVALRALAGADATHAQHFRFSILRVFGPTATAEEVNAAESHYKTALLTRPFGYNEN